MQLIAIWEIKIDMENTNIPFIMFSFSREKVKWCDITVYPKMVLL